MLGHRLFLHLRERFGETVVGTLRGSAERPPYRRIAAFAEGVDFGVDAHDFDTVAEVVERRRPRFIVNCVGIVKQRRAAAEAIPSIEINALFPHRLAQLGASVGARVIQISTDCVFNGRAGGYREESVSDAEDLYGRTKFLGETTAYDALTLRTSIIGRELEHFESLVEWLRRNRGGTVRGFTRHLYSGLPTLHLSRLLGRLLEADLPLRGLYQVASEPINKHDLLCLLSKAMGLNINVVAEHEPHCDRTLDGTRFAQATGYEVPPWPQLVTEMSEDPIPYDRWIGGEQ